MSTEERIARLEGLLERVRRNASRPRTATSVMTEPMSAAELEPIDGDGDVSAALIVDEATSGVIEISEPAIDMSEPFAEVEVEELELSEEEIVDLTEAEQLEVEEIPAVAAPAAAAAMDEMTLDWEDVDEPPASSRRPIAAASMDEALAEATEQIEMDEGREIPLKTPPPESGPQEAPPPQQALISPPVPSEAQPLSDRDILSGELSRDHEPPLEAIEIVEPESVPPIQIGEAELSPVSEAPGPMELAPESGEIAPEVVRRPPAVAATPSAYISASRGFRPSTFVELLDASLSLGE